VSPGSRERRAEDDVGGAGPLRWLRAVEGGGPSSAAEGSRGNEVAAAERSTLD